ncbi:MAG: T9SS type A sorting domain-containing protein [Chitinophagales bacterium]
MKYLFTLFLRTNILFIFFFSNVVDINAQEDTIPPVVTVFGPVPILQHCDNNYIEFGAIAYDDVDGVLDVSVSSDCICDVYFHPNTYVVTYTATDASGNIGEASRLVIVQGECSGVCPDDFCPQELLMSYFFAEDDFVQTQINTIITIPVLANDYGTTTSNPRVTDILTIPNHGIATIIDEQLIQYEPYLGYIGQDTLQYQSKNHSDWTSRAYVIIEVGTTSIEANPTYPSLQIFPNPAKDLLTIEAGTGLTAKQNVELLIFNTVGQLQVSYPISNVGTSKVNIEGLQKGLYIFQLKAKGEVLANGKVLVE